MTLAYPNARNSIMSRQKLHRTKDGKEIPLEDLTDGHLDCILAFIRRRAAGDKTILDLMHYDDYAWERSRRQKQKNRELRGKGGAQ
jgi:hypothetical protein